MLLSQNLVHNLLGTWLRSVAPSWNEREQERDDDADEGIPIALTFWEETKCRCEPRAACFDLLQNFRNVVLTVARRPEQVCDCANLGRTAASNKRANPLDYAVNAVEEAPGSSAEWARPDPRVPQRDFGTRRNRYRRRLEQTAAVFANCRNQPVVVSRHAREGTAEMSHALTTECLRTYVRVMPYQYQARCKCGAVWRVYRNEAEDAPCATCVACGEATYDLVCEGDDRASW